MRSMPLGLQKVAGIQAGAITHEQMALHGLRPRDAHQMIAAGLWQRISSRVVATYATPLERRTRLWAASLHHPRIGLTGAAALECEGLPESRHASIDLLGPRGSRQVPFEGCRITTTPSPHFATGPGPMRTAIPESVARAAGAAKSTRQAVFFLTWTIQRRLTTLDEVREAIAELPQSAGILAARRVLDMVDPGVHSTNEFDFSRECHRRGLPKPLRQVQRRDSRGNMRYTDVEFVIGQRSLVVEVDGLGHLETDVWVDDQWRQNELTLQGAVVIRIPGLALRTDPEPFFTQIAAALRSLAA